MTLSIELLKAKDEILKYAASMGLEPFETVFELIDYDQMNEVAAYGGFPTRYPHWRHGMEYEETAKGYAYGLHKIYELVINNDPCYAYLMKANSQIEQKMVIAHVYAHSDFFRNNMWFGKTNRKMMDEMANHGTRIRKYSEKFGEDAVEKFLDTVLSLENLYNYHSVYSPTISGMPASCEEKGDEQEPVRKLRAKEYLDRYINPPAFMQKQRKKRKDAAAARRKFPPRPEADVLLFLLENAPIDTWQRDVLSIVREEAYYFAPQAMTKIMNEGWATYWHSAIMTGKCSTDREIIDYADLHSSTMGTRPGVINPYKMGLELYKNIEERWNKGQFGKEWDDCDDMVVKKKWDRNLGQGRQKIFAVRRIYNDITFIDEFMTKEFCEEQKLFVYKYNEEANRYEIADRDPTKVKKQLLQRLTNLGNPLVVVQDGNFENRGELLLHHEYDGVELQLDEATDVLVNLHHVWQRPVNIETVVGGERKLVSFDGKEHKETSLGKSEES
ncbi:MAG: SpoVR family protein [Planctomycetota bacterium]|nr:SpoVR family protein [Planctomycetota bacterium]